MEEIVRAKIQKECEEGWVLAPFMMLPVHNLQITPVGVLTKKALGEYCLIPHLLYPCGELVNDVIPDELCSVRYTLFHQAVQVVRNCGLGAEMVKCDIKSVFHLLLVHPQDFELLGFSFEGNLYMDQALPMGAVFPVWHLKSLIHFLNRY